MKKTQRTLETAKTDYSLLKEFIKNLSQGELYKIRNIVTAQIQQKRSDYNLRNDTYRKYNGVDTTEVRIQRLLDEDWSDLFVGKYDGRNDYYVYAHTDPLAPYKCHDVFSYGQAIRIVKPIYIGMGTGLRYINFKRSKLHQDKLSSLMAHGYSRNNLSYKICEGMSLGKALELESKLILLFGCLGSGGDEIRSFYGESACLFNAQYEPYPDVWNDLPCSHSNFGRTV